MAYTIVYNTGDGSIVQELLSTDTPYIGAGQSTVSSPIWLDTTLYYVLAGVLTLRPSFNTSSWNTLSIQANATDTATFGSSIPTGTTCEIVPQFTTSPIKQVITDGIVSITSTVAANILVQLSLWPYLSYFVTVRGLPVGSIGGDTKIFTQSNNVATPTRNISQLLPNLNIQQTNNNLSLIQNWAQLLQNLVIVQTNNDAVLAQNIAQVLPNLNITQIAGDVQLISEG